MAPMPPCSLALVALLSLLYAEASRVQPSKQSAFDKQENPNDDGEDSETEELAHQQGKFTHRYNRVDAVRAETMWAVRVLKKAIKPIKAFPDEWPGHWASGKTGMDLLWAWIQAMEANDKSGIPFKLNPPMDDVAKLRNVKGPQGVGAFVAAFFVGHDFKNGVDKDGRQIYGMDFYVGDHMHNPDAHGVDSYGQVWSLYDRFNYNRSQPYFKSRGRIHISELPKHVHRRIMRRGSIENVHAGIAPLEQMPSEAQGFFPVLVGHGGKSTNVAEDLVPKEMGGNSNNPTNRLFRSLGAPFIGGASGSIEYMVLSIEDDCAGTCEGGLVPFKNHRVREALLGLKTAALIAGGQHSLTECLEVAQAMGYFNQIPKILDNYALSAATFEMYMGSLGFGVGKEQGPLVTMAYARMPAEVQLEADSGAPLEPWSECTSDSACRQSEDDKAKWDTFQGCKSGDGSEASTADKGICCWSECKKDCNQKSTPQGTQYGVVDKDLGWMMCS